MKTSAELKTRKEEVEPMKTNPAEMKHVTGGKPIDWRDTRMVCFTPGCFYTEIRKGYYVDYVVECPHCHEISLKGVEVV